MKKMLVSLVLFITSSLFAQLYEEAYYIDNNGKRVEGLIKLLDWKYNPDSFDYKSSETAPKKHLTIKDVKEFGAKNRFDIYRRFPVAIDTASDRWDNLTFDRKPVYVKDTLFLKLLVDGGLSLYEYNDGSFQRFFYQKEDETPVQLIFKKYMVNVLDKESNEEESKMKTNKGYILQLKKLMADCPSMSADEFQIPHKKKSLVNLFIRYNKCKGTLKQEVNKYNFWDHLRVGALAGVQFTDLDFYYIRSRFSTHYTRVYFGSHQMFRVGAELQYVMFFDQRRWSMFFEPTFLHLKGFDEDVNNKYTINYNAVSLGAGFRRSFYLNEDHTIFLKFGKVYDISLSSSKFQIEYQNYDYKKELEIFTSNSFILGLGYEYKRKFGAFFRYYTKTNLMRYSGINFYSKRFEVGVIYFIH